MVEGIETFRQFFQGYESAYAIIGGVACDEWFDEQDLVFRTTKDVDMVLLLENFDKRFAERFWTFVEKGQYDCRQKSTGKRIFYRFHTPQVKGFPKMLELFSRTPPGIELFPKQEIVPISAETDVSSLSAILMDDAYYDLVKRHRKYKDGMPLVDAQALILLKAAAWLDLNRLKASGEKVDSKKLKKHRNDAFLLAHILPQGEGIEIASSIRKDLNAFLKNHAADSPNWDSITKSVGTAIASPLQPVKLLEIMSDFYGLNKLSRKTE